jgi:hypothetical protein
MLYAATVMEVELIKALSGSRVSFLFGGISNVDLLRVGDSIVDDRYSVNSGDNLEV